LLPENKRRFWARSKNKFGNCFLGGLVKQHNPNEEMREEKKRKKLSCYFLLKKQRKCFPETHGTDEKKTKNNKKILPHLSQLS
jgi:hypothetical protein